MKLNIKYIGWHQPSFIESKVNNWLDENPTVMIQGIEHKTKENSSDVLTVITYIEGALDAQQQPQGDPVPEDMG